MYVGTFNSQLDSLDLSMFCIYVPGPAFVVTYNEQSKWGGVNMDNWSADSGSGGSCPSGLHLHHHDGLPRSLHLSPLCSLPQGSLRSLCQTVEKEVEHILYRGRHKRGEHFVVKHVAISHENKMAAQLTNTN